jgi:hypothetical protein
MPALPNQMSISPRVLVRGRDQGRHALLGCGVAGRGVAADRGGDLHGRARVQVVHDNPRAPGSHPGGQRATDAVPRPGDHHAWPDGGPLIRRRR